MKLRPHLSPSIIFWSRLGSSSSPPPGLSSHPARIGVIVGPVIGLGVPLLLLLGYILYKCRRTRAPFPPETLTETSITPFDSEFPHETKGSPRLQDLPNEGLDIVLSTTHDNPGIPGLGSPEICSVDSPTNEIHDRGRVVELQAELAQASNGGQSSTAEIQAMRRDLQQFMHIVERAGGIDLVPPPEYDAD